MNISDVLVTPIIGLQQDSWSATSPTFGDEGQLQVIGHDGGKGGKKYYILSCSKCSQDSGLFGDGIFKSLKGNLMKGRVPCGCSKSIKWDREQYHVLCSRKASDIGCVFLGFVGVWKAQNTKIKMACEKHGEWSTGSIGPLINMGAGCVRCGVEVSSRINTKPDEAMIASFHNSGAFHSNTQFWRSTKLSSNGYKPYWFMYCGECGETRESMSGGLQKGCLPCACGKEARRIATIKTHTKPDEVMIKSFFDSEAFHADTKFWRSDRLDSRGTKRYWLMYCPECKETAEATSCNLQRGKRPCGCSKQRQQECYINFVVDGDNKVALKFGIANNSKQRIKVQNRKSVYELIQHEVYKFPDVSSCKKAERDCKKKLDCGILLKRDMPDGWSETTWIYNLSKIQEIYKKFGGVLQNKLDSTPIET